MVLEDVLFYLGPMKNEERELVEELLRENKCDFIFSPEFFKTINLLPSTSRNKKDLQTVISLFEDLSSNDRSVVHREVLKTPFKERMELIEKFEKIYKGQYVADYNFVDESLGEMRKRLETALSSTLKSDYWFGCMVSEEVRTKSLELIPREEEAIDWLKELFQGTRESEEIYQELEKVPPGERVDVIFKACALLKGATEIGVKRDTIHSLTRMREREAVFTTFQKYFTGVSGEEALVRFIATGLVPKQERTEEVMEGLIHFFDTVKEREGIKGLFQALGYFKKDS